MGFWFANRVVDEWNSHVASTNTAVTFRNRLDGFLDSVTRGGQVDGSLGSEELSWPPTDSLVVVFSCS